MSINQPNVDPSTITIADMQSYQPAGFFTGDEIAWMNMDAAAELHLDDEEFLKAWWLKVSEITGSTDPFDFKEAVETIEERWL